MYEYTLKDVPDLAIHDRQKALEIISENGKSVCPSCNATGFRENKRDRNFCVDCETCRGKGYI